MEPLGVVRSILGRSTDAVVTYREISGLPDNELPEVFIASNIAVPLHRDLGLLCRCEYLYTRIASALGATLTDEVLKSMGGFHADLALFDASHHPLVAVEVKIDADGRPPFAIINDIDKLRMLTRLCTVMPLVLTMMTDLPNRELKDRRAELETRTPGVVWAWGQEQRARDDKWSWQMCCAQVGAS